LPRFFSSNVRIIGDPVAKTVLGNCARNSPFLPDPGAKTVLTGIRGQKNKKKGKKVPFFFKENNIFCLFPFPKLVD
jgi:hypothetical protein